MELKVSSQRAEMNTPQQILTDDGAVDDGTGNKSEETDEQISQTDGERLVFFIDTPTKKS